VEQVVKEMRESSTGDRGVLTFAKKVINQRNEVVQTGTTTILLAKRASAGKSGIRKSECGSGN
jgi:acyl dehydratase